MVMLRGSMAGQSTAVEGPADTPKSTSPNEPNASLQQPLLGRLGRSGFCGGALAVRVHGGRGRA
jgi:hypothetical protein